MTRAADNNRRVLLSGCGSCLLLHLRQSTWQLSMTVFQVSIMHLATAAQWCVVALIATLVLLQLTSHGICLLSCRSFHVSAFQQVAVLGS
jgi:hypothetical protein